MKPIPWVLSLYVGACACGVGHAQAPHSPPADPPRRAASLEHHRLANGLDVILSRDPSIPVVGVQVSYHVGSSVEEPGRTGLAHLFEHLMFEGSAHLGRGEHARIIQEGGGETNAWTNRDFTWYATTVPSNYLETVLWLEAERMGSLLPGLTQESLDVQREVVKNEQRQRRDNQPAGRVNELVHLALYPAGHPYANVTAALEDLDALTLRDLEAFYRTYYTPGNAVLAIVGDFDPAETLVWVERYYGALPPGLPVDRPPLPPVFLSEPRHLVLEAPVRVPALRVAWVTGDRYADGDAPLDVFASMLANGRNSPLQRRLLAEEQLAQAVFVDRTGDSQARLFQVIVSAREGVELDRIAAIVDEEIERVRRNPPDPAEIERAVNDREATLIRGLQRPLDVAHLLSTYLLFAGDAFFFEEDLARYRSVTADSIQSAVRRYLGEGRVILSVVPVGRSDLRVTP